MKQQKTVESRVLEILKECPMSRYDDMLLMSKPIGVSEYHLCTDLPLDLKNALPAVEDIRSRIDMKK